MLLHALYGSKNFLLNFSCLSAFARRKEKTFKSNFHKTKGLENTFKKDQKRTCENEKKYYFCTRIGREVHLIIEKRIKKIKVKFY